MGILKRIFGLSRKNKESSSTSKRYSEIKLKSEKAQDLSIIRQSMADTRMSCKDICKKSENVPNVSGLYAWFFDDKLTIPPGEYFEIGGCRLLYIGIAKKNPSSNATLRKRISDFHLGHAADTSTLRFSLAYLLREELNLKIKYRRGNKSWWLGSNCEKRLTKWMNDHASVAWLKNEEPWEIEEAMLRLYGSTLPLNIQGNRNRSEFARHLSVDRSEWRKNCLLGIRNEDEYI